MKDLIWKEVVTTLLVISIFVLMFLLLGGQSLNGGAKYNLAASIMAGIFAILVTIMAGYDMQSYANKHSAIYVASHPVIFSVIGFTAYAIFSSFSSVVVLVIALVAVSFMSGLVTLTISKFAFSDLKKQKGRISLFLVAETLIIYCLMSAFVLF